MKVTNKITLDVLHARAPQTVFAKQDDSSGVRQLLVQVTANRVPLALSADNIPTLRIYEGGMEYAWTTGDVTEDGLALVHLPKFEVSGVFQADVTLVTLEEDGTTSTISTEPFRLDVGGYKEFDTSAEKVVYIAALPVVSAADAGKVLTVSELGTWTARKPDAALPAVTVEDDGKILMVVDGGWGVVAFPAGTQYDMQTITIPADSGWVVNDSGVHHYIHYTEKSLDGCDIDVSLLSSSTPEQFEAAAESGIYCAAATGAEIEFRCLYSIPTVDLSFSVRITTPKTLSYTVDEETMTMNIVEE